MTKNLLAKPLNHTDVNEMYVRSMGKLFKVTGLFESDDDTNAYLRTHSTEGVIAQFGRHIYVAELSATTEVR